MNNNERRELERKLFGVIGLVLYGDIMNDSFNRQRLYEAINHCGGVEQFCAEYNSVSTVEVQEWSDWFETPAEPVGL